MNTKICKQCGIEKNICVFELSDGYRRNKCKECRKSSVQYGDTKTCTQCKVEQPIDNFTLSKMNYRNGKCKECRNKYFNQRYSCNEKHKINVKETRAKNVSLMLEYLSIHPCVDCGESDPIVLEFDHVRGEKKWNISSRVYSASKWSTIEKEIEKCDVRCANCHRKQTAKRAGGWYK